MRRLLITTILGIFLAIPTYAANESCFAALNRLIPQPEKPEFSKLVVLKDLVKLPVLYGPASWEALSKAATSQGFDVSKSFKDPRQFSNSTLNQLAENTWVQLVEIFRPQVPSGGSEKIVEYGKNLGLNYKEFQQASSLVSDINKDWFLREKAVALVREGIKNLMKQGYARERNSSRKSDYANFHDEVWSDDQFFVTWSGVSAILLGIPLSSVAGGLGMVLGLLAPTGIISSIMASKSLNIQLRKWSLESSAQYRRFQTRRKIKGEDGLEWLSLNEKPFEYKSLMPELSKTTPTLNTKSLESVALYGDDLQTLYRELLRRLGLVMVNFQGDASVKKLHYALTQLSGERFFNSDVLLFLREVKENARQVLHALELAQADAQKFVEVISEHKTHLESVQSTLLGESKSENTISTVTLPLNLEYVSSNLARLDSAINNLQTQIKTAQQILFVFTQRMRSLEHSLQQITQKKATDEQRLSLKTEIESFLKDLER